MGRFTNARDRLFVAGVFLLVCSCTEEPLKVSGQLGRPFPQLSGDNLTVPRVVASLQGCSDEAGGCTRFCDDAPEVCAQRADDSCMAVLVDTGSPITTMSSLAPSPSIGKACLELRAGESVADPNQSVAALAGAVARLRFDDAPHARLPAESSQPWAWRTGDGSLSRHVAGVLGGNILNDFAVHLRAAPGQPPSLALYSEFPGDEPGLAAQGRAFLPVQYPQQLVGVIAQDGCEIAGVSCELAGLDLDPDDERIILESTRIVVDACLSPPPCAPHDDPATNDCRLSPGGSTPEFGCADAQAGANSGVGASLVVATGVPGMVLFEDSARRLFGALESLPSCDELDPGTATATLACRDAETTTLHVPGWPAMGPTLARVRLRSLSLVPGLGASSGPSACARHQERIEGIGAQCAVYVREHVPRPPFADELPTTASIDGGLLILGEVKWSADQDGPDPTRWITASILPASDRFVTALRRDVGSRPLQIDGLLGAALLRDTDVVFDYTEQDPGPGMRVTCLDPEAGDCLSAPACGTADGEIDVACCFGTPQALLRRVISASAIEPSPRREELCCPALSHSGLVELQDADPAVCTGTEPL